MKASVKEKWLRALRSGDYKQGRTRLRKKDRGEYRYCCLGVLATELGREPAEVGHEQTLKPDFAEPLGLTSLTQQRLAVMNDSGRSFEQIADYIEEKL